MKSYITFLCAALLGYTSLFANPKADSRSEVTVGNARFTVLTPSLVRMEWSKNQRFEDRATQVAIDRNFDPVKFTRKVHGKSVTITTGQLVLEYKDNGRPFNASNLSVHFTVEGKRTVWRPGMKDPLNLKGTTRTVDQCDAVTPEMLEQGIISRSGWAVWDDSKSLVFDGKKGEEWIAVRPDTTVQDLYIFAYGHRYREALKDYTHLAGRIPMPPKYALGYWYSRYFCYSDAEIKEIVEEMRRYDIPLDVFIIDMDWHNTYGISANKGNMIGWTGYTWNRTLFPNPEATLQWLHDRDLKVSLNLHPADGIYRKEECFPAMANRLSIDTIGLERISYDMDQKSWADAYFSEVIRPLERQGVDFWWLDWQQWIYSKRIPSLNNTWWINHCFFTDMERNRAERPVLFHRWGGMGNHRYPLGFSGDSHATFEMLASLPYFTATASNVAFGYWSHDIGGHMQKEEMTDAELYLRWIQFGVFSPVLRTHSSKQGNIERRIWKFPNFNAMNDALHLRYALAPYIYTACREAYDTGVSLCRPMYYDYPDRKEAYANPQQYMFGNDLIVAPIATRADTFGLARQKIWLPQGEWYDLSRGARHRGTATFSAAYTQSEIPYFARAGAIIPMNPRVRNLQTDPRHLVITAIAGENGSTDLYEDGGNDRQYQEGVCAWTRIAQQREGRDVTIKVSPRKGTFSGASASRAYTFRLPGNLPARKVTVNGKEYGYAFEPTAGAWSYDAPAMTLVVSVPQTDCAQEVIVRITTETDQDLTFTHGFRAIFQRLEPIVMEIKMEVSKRDWARSPSDLLLKISQIPSMIQYQPQSAPVLLQQFKIDFERAMDELIDDYGFPKTTVDRYRKQVLGE